MIKEKHIGKVEAELEHLRKTCEEYTVSLAKAEAKIEKLQK